MNQVSIKDLLSGRVRLRFGDEGQLTAIKIFEKMEEDSAKRCKVCNGEGSIVCDACEGTGEI